MKPSDDPITIAMRTGRGMNDHELPIARVARVKHERKIVGGYLFIAKRPSIPCRVRLTRIAPSSGLDDDNLVSSLKSVRDTVADWMRVDDKHRDVVRYEYAQERGPWGVRIEFSQSFLPETPVIEIGE